MEIQRINNSQSHLVTGLFDRYRVFYNQPSDENLAGQFIRERLEKNESVIFVAFEMHNGTPVPVGFTQLYPQLSSVRASKNWVLNDLYVDAEFRQRGIGEKLIKAAADFARSERATFLTLETATDNIPAQKLYSDLGFKKQQPDEGFLHYRLEL